MYLGRQVIIWDLKKTKKNNPLRWKSTIPISYISENFYFISGIILDILPAECFLQDLRTDSISELFLALSAYLHIYIYIWSAKVKRPGQLPSLYMTGSLEMEGQTDIYMLQSRHAKDSIIFN